MIGDRLKKLRRSQKINQDELAAIIGVKGSAVSRYETNKDDPSDNIKVEIAKHFNVSLDYLLGVIDDAVPYYNTVSFLQLPEGISEEDRMMLMEFIGYLKYRMRILSNAQI